MTARVLMIQGTGSSAGKSLLTAALCRVYARRGIRVAPFKAQNMSNNAMVCADGAEIGRSQALQAFAARTDCHSDMNPVLLKPEGDNRSQVIVNGRPWQTLAGRQYYERRKLLWPVVTAALDRLRQRYELVIIEGAGSPAELNLAELEIVNMAIARYADSPVVLVGDIERGGIFAQLLGTLWLLDPADRQRVAGLVVNKFRGDLRLFDRGVELLQERGGTPVLGVLPWLDSCKLPEEDAFGLTEDALGEPADNGAAELDIAIVRLPRISNFDDFDPLGREPGVRIRFIESLAQLGRPAVVILPGTKNTLDDLQWLRQSGLAARICQLAEQGTVVVGICGGYQMLGQVLENPAGVESDIRSAQGLGLLPVHTVFAETKRTHQVLAEIVDDTICPGMRRMHITGYEIHSGQTRSPGGWLKLFRNSDDRRGTIDGARSIDGRIWGCYVHGLFDNDRFRRAWLTSLGVSPVAAHVSGMAAQQVDAELERLADAVETYLDIEQLDTIIHGAELLSRDIPLPCASAFAQVGEPTSPSRREGETCAATNALPGGPARSTLPKSR